MAGVIAVLIIGTIGYYHISGGEHSLLDTFYMTVITISTIGFGEVIDLSASPAGRVFTIFIAIAGIGFLFYIITNLTAFVVEGELTKSFRSRKMEKRARSFSEHYIVCGMGEVGIHVAHELAATNRPFIALDINREHIEKALEAFPNMVYIEGDATDDNTLLKAGIKQARGIFITTAEDNQNLVVTLTVKQLNPEVRIISRCNELKNGEKMRKAGADAVISPCFIGGLRMASEMVRPTVVSFLDTMLRDKEKNLRVEEVSVPDSLNGKTVSV